MFFRLIELAIAIYYDALGGDEQGDDSEGKKASDIRKHIEAQTSLDGTYTRYSTVRAHVTRRYVHTPRTSDVRVAITVAQAHNELIMTGWY